MGFYYLYLTSKDYQKNEEEETDDEAKYISGLHQPLLGFEKEKKVRKKDEREKTIII